MRYLRLLLLCVPAIALPVASFAALPDVPVPAPAASRIAATEIQVRPDRDGWTYAPGERVTFLVDVLWDQQPVGGVEVQYTVAPDMMVGEQRTAVVPREGLQIDGGTMQEPGFLRRRVTAGIGGERDRGRATEGCAPDKSGRTQTDPEDFDAFWKSCLEELAEIPLEPRMELIPEASTGTINVYHVS